MTRDVGNADTVAIHHFPTLPAGDNQRIGYRGAQVSTGGHPAHVAVSRKVNWVSNNNDPTLIEKVSLSDAHSAYLKAKG